MVQNNIRLGNNNKIKLRGNKNTKAILGGLLIGGVLIVGMISPIALGAFASAYLANKKQNTKSFADSFYYLKRKGCIKFEKKNHQIYISLTKKGQEKAKRHNVDSLKIKKPKKWDKKWRIVFFDIPADKRVIRDALRGKLKQLNFYQLQKSVWIYPFDCLKEIEFLKKFFRLSDRKVRLIITDNIGEDKLIKTNFNL